jgi:uncharacterized protein YebE (UPF0316 family)
MQVSAVSNWGEPGAWLAPTLVFIAGLVYLSVDSLRVMFLSRGMKVFSSALGFIEVLVFILGISQVLSNLQRWDVVLAYAAGFACGNGLGILIEERLAVGHVLVRIVTRSKAPDLLKHLGARGYGVTSVDGTGNTGRVRIIFTITRRRNLRSLQKSLQAVQPDAFISVADVRNVTNRSYPLRERSWLTRTARMGLGRLLPAWGRKTL